ncbi:hypothetical protein LCGC14_0488760 [marine sediment metagenome]|uniref:DUF5681 domain-containing protein n=1 Tax=marine sediment metagenome TaxID=412755 RepID=A0A0F9SCJ3_9ZZZZ
MKQANNSNLKAGEPHRWKPGESGNPNGRPKNSVTAMLKNASEEDRKAIADKVIELAKEGKIEAIREYIDRTDGKVPSELKVEGEILITPNMRALAAKEMIEIKEEETKLLVNTTE